MKQGTILVPARRGAGMRNRPLFFVTFMDDGHYILNAETKGLTDCHPKGRNRKHDEDICHRR